MLIKTYLVMCIRNTTINKLNCTTCSMLYQTKWAFGQNYSEQIIRIIGLFTKKSCLLKTNFDNLKVDYEDFRIYLKIDYGGFYRCCVGIMSDYFKMTDPLRSRT